MKRRYTFYFAFICLVFMGCIFSYSKLEAQGCVNADFSQGNFTGWTGTFSMDQCSEPITNNRCSCSATNPYNTPGFNQGPNDNPASDPTNEWNQIITTTAGGYDPLIAGFGYNMPTVWPGNMYSARIGNMWQEVGDIKTGDGESISYSFVVTTANCNFTYHYAVVLYSGNHTPGQQAFFNISMVANGTDSIACAAYQVDATTAATIGGFSMHDSIFWKPWSSVVVPLSNYIGQTVNITFTTRGCIPKGCAGKHYAYAYISAECGPLNLSATSGIDCGLNDTLYAPVGSATYSWTGPGIVGSDTNQMLIINQPGKYVVNMTTFGNTPCGFSMDTVIAGVNLHPNFTHPVICQGSPVIFTDISTPAGASAWDWNFGDGGTATSQNPTHTFANTGTFAVTLTVTNGPCTRDTTINVVVSPPPIASFTAVSPECEGSNSNIVYTGNEPAYFNFDWDFDGGTGIPVTGRGPLNISWQTPGIKTITLTVSAGPSCTSAPDTEYVLVKPYPGMTLTPYTHICLGDSAVLTAANATVYTWAPDPTLNNTDSSVVIATPVTTTTYYVTGTNTNCISVDTVSVGVFTVPTSTFTATGPVCIGQNSTVTYTGNGGNNSTYNWNFGGGTASPDTGQGPFMVHWLTPGNAYITLTVTQSGCSNPVTDTISVYSTPHTPILTTDTFTGCPGLQVCFTSSPVGNNIGYIWNFGDGDTTGQQNPCHLYQAPGLYSVAFQVALSPECIFDTTLQNLITVINNPVAAFTPSSTLLQQPQSQVTFTNQTQYAISYLWNFALAGNQILDSSTAFNTQFNFEQYGQYNVTLYAFNQLGCPDSNTQQITVLPAEGYFIPNAFTPNGDGINDEFFPILQEGATLLSFQIFDRWGEKVHDGLFPWDGNYKGKKAPEAVYVYRANIHLIDQDLDIERKGSVTLLR